MRAVGLFTQQIQKKSNLKTHTPHRGKQTVARKNTLLDFLQVTPNKWSAKKYLEVEIPNKCLFIHAYSDDTGLLPT